MEFGSVGGNSTNRRDSGRLCRRGYTTKFVKIDQGVDQETLDKFHHTDQGIRMTPAAWLAAIERADGGGKFMSSDNLRRLGLLGSECRLSSPLAG
jgi:hypothetical protein